MKIGKEAGYVLCEECKHRAPESSDQVKDGFAFHQCAVRPNEDFVAGAFLMCKKWEKRDE